jgi:hypothetical protein
MENEEQTGIYNNKHLSEYFDILSNERRRLAIQILTELGEVSVSELSEEIASAEYGKDPEMLTSDERKRVYTSMNQVHIPKLENCGVVIYNGHKVEPTEKSYELVRYLHRIEDCNTQKLPWLCRFAISSIVLAAAASVLLVRIKKSGSLLTVAAVLLIAAAVIGFYMTYTYLMKVDDGDLTVCFIRGRR